MLFTVLISQMLADSIRNMAVRFCPSEIVHILQRGHGKHEDDNMKRFLNPVTYSSHTTHSLVFQESKLYSVYKARKNSFPW